MSKPIHKNVVFWILAILLALFLGISAGVLAHLLREAFSRIEKENETQGDIDGLIWHGGGMGIVGLSTFLSKISGKADGVRFFGMCSTARSGDQHRSSNDRIRTRSRTPEQETPVISCPVGAIFEWSQDMPCQHLGVFCRKSA